MTSSTLAPLDKPIFVTGLPQSGTSLVAAILHHGGAWVGNCRDTDAGDPTGSWQNRQISERLIQPVMSNLKCDPFSAPSLPSTVFADRPHIIRSSVRGMGDALRAIVSSEGYDGSCPWLYQDPNLLLLWPNFIDPFPEARWIIVRRDLDRFVESCMETGHLARRSTDEAIWLDLGAEYLQRIDGLRDYNGGARELWIDELFVSGPSAALPIHEHLDLQWKPDLIADLTDRAGWPHQAPRKAAGGKPLRLIKHFRSGDPYAIKGSVALVGNSDGLAGRKLGHRIDQYDHVFRFNLAPAGGEFQEDAGGKATCYYLNKAVTLKNHPPDHPSMQRLRDICQSCDVICHPGHFQKLIPLVEPYHFEMGTHEINDVFVKLLGSVYSPFPHANPPRNGIRLLAALIDAGCRPALFGFDLGIRQRNSHYYDDLAQVDSVGSGHQPSREYRLLNQLRHRGLIEVVQ